MEINDSGEKKAGKIPFLVMDKISSHSYNKQEKIFGRFGVRA